MTVETSERATDTETGRPPLAHAVCRATELRLCDGRHVDPARTTDRPRPHQPCVVCLDLCTKCPHCGLIHRWVTP